MIKGMIPVKLYIQNKDGTSRVVNAYVDELPFQSEDAVDIANKELLRAVESGEIDGVLSMRMEMTDKQKYWLRKNLKNLNKNCKVSNFIASDYSKTKFGKDQNNNWRKKLRKFGGYNG